MVISKNEERNMQMETKGGITQHVPINPDKMSRPKTGIHNPKEGKTLKLIEKHLARLAECVVEIYTHGRSGPAIKTKDAQTD